jgi:plasmid stability protein
MYALCSNIAYRGSKMPLLQVRDVPEELYQKLAQVAEAEHRSIAQETIVLLKKALGLQQERVARRQAVLVEIKKASLGKGRSFSDAAALIREDRDR